MIKAETFGYSMQIVIASVAMPFILVMLTGPLLFGAIFFICTGLIKIFLPIFKNIHKLRETIIDSIIPKIND
jgi:hypothetical protein